MRKPLTETEIASLKALARVKSPWRGVGPGSNFWPFLELEVGDIRVDGEDIDALARKGMLEAKPVSAGTEDRVIPGGDFEKFGEIPDIDCPYDWRISAAGRAALAEQEKGDA